MYHNDSAYNPFTDPEGYAGYIVIYPEEWAMDHANLPVERVTPTPTRPSVTRPTRPTTRPTTAVATTMTSTTPSISPLTTSPSPTSTSRGFNGNGVYYSGVRGFHVTRLDTVDNGAYGIYVTRSTMGVFETPTRRATTTPGSTSGRCSGVTA